MVENWDWNLTLRVLALLLTAVSIGLGVLHLRRMRIFPRLLREISVVHDTLALIRAERRVRRQDPVGSFALNPVVTVLNV